MVAIAPDSPKPHLLRPDELPRDVRMQLMRDALARRHSKAVFEVRALDYGGRPRCIRSGYFDNPDAAVEEIFKVLPNFDKSSGVYTVLNPIKPALLARSNNKFVENGKTTSDDHVIRRTKLQLDFDQSHGISGISATDDERKEANEAAFSIETWLHRDFGWGLPEILNSGNGVQLIYNIDLPNDPEKALDSTNLVKRVLVAVAARLANPEFPKFAIKVDTAVYNAAQMARLPGTWNRKGESTTDRKHRLVELAIPDSQDVVNPIPRECLEAVACLAPESDARTRVAVKGHSPSGGSANGSASGNRARIRMEEWLGDCGVKFEANPGRPGEIRYDLDACPFCGRSKKASFYQQNGGRDDGRPGFKCHHSDCTTLNWHDASRAIGKPVFPQHYDVPASHSPSQPASATKQSSTPPPIPEGTRVRAGDKDNFGVVVEDHGESCLVRFKNPATGAEAEKPLSKSLLVDATTGRAFVTDPANRPEPLKVIDSATFDASEYSMRWLVNDIMVSGQPVIIGGRSKSMKTTLAVDMAISLGTETPFLGKFPARRSRTLLLSGETGDATLQETARRICASKNVSLASADVIWGFQLPSIGTPEGLDLLANAITINNIEVAIIDPAYLCLMGDATRGLNAGNLFDMGPLLLRLAEVGTQTGATMCLLHHCRKNSPNERYDPPDLEELSMSGFAEFARQWVMLGRREQYKNDGHHRLWLKSGGSVGHSGTWGVDITEGILQPDFSGRTWKVEVKSEADVIEEKKSAREVQKKNNSEETLASRKLKIVDELRGFPDGATKSKIKENLRISGTNIDVALKELVSERFVEKFMARLPNGSFEHYRLLEGRES